VLVVSGAEDDATGRDQLLDRVVALAGEERLPPADGN
jgi:hypothetical protein